MVILMDQLRSLCYRRLHRGHCHSLVSIYLIAAVLLEKLGGAHQHHVWTIMNIHFF